MKMINIISLSIMMLFTGCKSENPTNTSIVGKWVSKDGAIFEFVKEGIFSTQDLPKDKFLPFPEKYEDTLFSEAGKWEMKNEQGRWFLQLYFTKSESLPLGCATQIYISGSKGIMEDQPPWYLFFWEGEEGGFRYKFSKKE